MKTASVVTSLADRQVHIYSKLRLSGSNYYIQQVVGHGRLTGTSSCTVEPLRTQSARQMIQLYIETSKLLIQNDWAILSYLGNSASKSHCESYP